MRCAIVCSLLLVLTALPLAAETKTNVAYVEPVTLMEFVAVPGGSFLMGEKGNEWASPVHKVTVKPFLIGRYEVTFAQYALFCAATKRELPSDNGWGRGTRPAINVSWLDAVAFTKWLSDKSGRTFRLPSEAEWEYAARGGMTTPYPWGGDLGKNRANCNGCGSTWDNRNTAPVGSFAANDYGLYDVVGNVYEWTLDLRHDNYQGAPNNGSPWTKGSSSTERVNRGASYSQPLEEMAVSRRCWDEPEFSKSDLGFRVLLEP